MKTIACVMSMFGLLIWLDLPGRAGGLDSAFDGVLNATYMIETTAVRLVDGRAEAEAAPDSATKMITAVYGKPVLGDLDGNGREDAALFLEHDPGGSGTFYYVACAIAKNGDYAGTNAVLLEDRVVPRSIQIQNGVIIVHYDYRRPDEPMVTPPSVAKTVYLKLKAGRLESTETP